MRPYRLAFAFTLVAAYAPVSAEIYAPEDAIMLAKATPAGKSGQFYMNVVSTGRTPNGVFLNSTADYRRDDNLTFRLRLIVAREFEKRYGAPIEVYFRGKHVVVAGKVIDEPIANVRYGRPSSLNRYQHVVPVDRLDQLISVSP